MRKVKLSTLKIKKTSELRWLIIFEEEIKIRKELCGNRISKEIVEFIYYKDKNGDYWLYNCNVPDKYQKQGIGTIMIKKAIEEYGQIYFSNASRPEFNAKYPNQGYDSRYLTDEGKSLVKSLIRNNVIPKEWHRFPVI